ncbi:TAXI family TRAP transporter solute-binding subunit [Nonomuraea soli]|uniref:TAXI family TRAP transporter solute-binding subunit n=1 Tax=Nonomuraea soli TaxID=1032476 RepID=A0A7W0CFT4_9ACTN|nr:TAXI family TRAP transporter solute-binding subunit [Nonomuraea soli]MBA2890397.1 hypothetical protein [Nonomuraea soli]
MKRLIAGAAVAVMALTGAAGCGGQGNRLTIATGGTTGVYYVYGGGLANQLKANIENTTATASVTSASLENIKLLAEKKADIGFSQTDAAADAITGTGSFDSKQPVKAIARIYDNYTHVVVAPGVSATKLADLKGMKVSLGPANSGTQVVARRMLEAVGLNPDTDVQKQQLSINESVQAVKDGTIDAFFWVGGVPTAGIVDLATSKKEMKLLDTSDVMGGLSSKFGETYVSLDVDLAAAYKLTGAIKTVGVANVLLVHEGMSDDLAYNITKTLFEKKAEMVKVHKEAEKLDTKLGAQVQPIPLHPGAERYFKEKNG